LRLGLEEHLRNTLRSTLRLDVEEHLRSVEPSF
jgi:hypothetical protein